MSDERDETRPGNPSPQPRPGDPGATRPDNPGVAPGADDPTRVAPRPDSTSVMPHADDWAPSRANPVWSGRAEVRSPQPGRSGYDTDWPVGPPPQQHDRWWMPILVGVIVLVLLGLLGWGIYVIVQNSGNENPGTAPSATAATTATTTETTEPSTTPTTTETTTTSPTPSTTEPTTTEVTVPALRGLSLEEAQAALARTGLRSRVIYRNGNAPPGTVIDSDPAEGQEVPPDTRVTLVVARGSTTTPTATTVGPAAGD